MKIIDWLLGKKTQQEKPSPHASVKGVQEDYCKENTLRKETAEIVSKALDIINRQVVLSPVFHVKDSGQTGPVMEAANFLKQASILEPENASLHYAYVGALRLAAQFKTAEEESEKLIRLHPDFPLIKFSAEAWSDRAVISPSPFAYPEWTTASSTLSDFYKDKLHTCILLPAREGIYARGVLFEKDNDRWWTKEKLRGVKAEIAVVLAPGQPNIAAIYRRCTGSGLTKPDIQESLYVLDLPKDELSLVGLEYLVEADFTDVVIVDYSNSVVVNQRVPISSESKVTLGRVRDILLDTKGREMPKQEMMSALQRYQSGADLDDIERRYFRK